MAMLMIAIRRKKERRELAKTLKYWLPHGHPLERKTLRVTLMPHFYSALLVLSSATAVAASPFQHHHHPMPSEPFFCVL